MATYGFVYVMLNPCMPGVYKIGMTLRSPKQRAIELFSATGVPGDFEVVYYMEVESPEDLERHLHTTLDNRRVNEKREFFRVPLGEIITLARGWDSHESESYGEEGHEALSPGLVSPRQPLWFEEGLHDRGWLRRISVEACKAHGMKVVS